MVECLPVERVLCHRADSAYSHLPMRCAADVPCAFNADSEFLIRIRVDVCPCGTSVRGEIDGEEACCIGWRQRRFAVGLNEAVVAARGENEQDKEEIKRLFHVCHWNVGRGPVPRDACKMRKFI